MSQIDVKPYVMRDATLELDVDGTPDTYELQCNRIVLTPTSQVLRWNGLAPAGRKSIPTATDWTLDLQFAQDLETADALSTLLLANDGGTATFTFRPKAGGKGYTGTVTLSPGPIGGDADAIATGTVSLGVDGQPAEVAALP